MPYQQTGSLFFNTDLLQKRATVTKTLAKMVEPAPKRTLDLSVFALPNGAASIAAVPVSLAFLFLYWTSRASRSQGVNFLRTIEVQTSSNLKYIQNIPHMLTGKVPGQIFFS